MINNLCFYHFSAIPPLHPVGCLDGKIPVQPPPPKSIQFQSANFNFVKSKIRFFSRQKIKNNFSSQRRLDKKIIFSRFVFSFFGFFERERQIHFGHGLRNTFFFNFCHREFLKCHKVSHDNRHGSTDQF